MQRPPLLFQGALPEARPLVAVGAGEEEVPQGTFVRTTWPTGLFGCFAGQAFGTSDTLDCCCAQCCCSPCVWHSAYEYAGIPGSWEVVQRRIIAGVINNAAGDGQNSGQALLKAFATVEDVKASLGAAQFRRALHYKLYKVWFSQGSSTLVALCCGPCATCQEVDAVQRWAAETKGVQLTYGNVLQCDCWNLVAVDSKGQMLPKNRPLDGVYAMPVPPGVPVMQR